MKIGCHVSISKGFTQAAKNAYGLGASAFQVFTKNPRALKSKKLDMTDATDGREFCLKHDLVLVAHTPYITNLSTPKPDLHQITIRSIKEDLHIAEEYGAIGAVVHCGKHVGEGEDYGKKRMVETLNRILEEYQGTTKLLLENTAGQGTELGLMIDDLVEIRSLTDYPEKIGFCFDTCHGFAAGVWSENDFDAFMQKCIESGYLDNLVAIHFNDSKAPYLSRKDRHEKIGKGEIGESALSLFLHSPYLQHLPFVLETPVDDESEYAEEIQYVQRLGEEPKEERSINVG